MSDKQQRFLTKEKVQKLHKSTDFLNTYVTPDDFIDHIGPNINTENVYDTKLLRELGRINKRRLEIINQLMS